MSPPTKLAVHVSAVERLVKEEQSYHKEMHIQEKRIAKHRENKDTQENAEFLLNQELKALEETKKMFPELHQKIKDALFKLEDHLRTNRSLEGEASPEALQKADNVIAEAKAALAETETTS